MTNWMTAAGLALIAGGVATLISFRSVLFGRGDAETHPEQPQPPVLEPPQRRPALPPAEPDFAAQSIPLRPPLRRIAPPPRQGPPPPVQMPPSEWESAAREPIRRMPVRQRSVEDEIEREAEADVEQDFRWDVYVEHEPDPGWGANVEQEIDLKGEAVIEAEAEVREEAQFPEAVVSRRRGRRGRRRTQAAPSGRQFADPDGDEHGGLASIGFADRQDEEEAAEPYGRTDLHEEDEEIPAPYGRHDLDEDEEGAASYGRYDVPDEHEIAHPYGHYDLPEQVAEPGQYAAPQSRPVIDRSDRSYGHRIEGWVRPEYQDPPVEARSGEYWTPVPDDLLDDHEPSASGYGWPLPVERLPAVPSYQPVREVDLEPVSEPTEAMQVWDDVINDDEPGRVRLPRSWATRNEKDEPRRRPRPRPRPAPAPAENSTVYVSRHAAEPPR